MTNFFTICQIRKVFVKAIKVSQNNFRNHVNYAQMLFFTKNFEKSLNQYKKANLIIQNKIDILLGMGSTYFITGKTKEALQTREKV